MYTIEESEKEKMYALYYEAYINWTKAPTPLQRTKSWENYLIIRDDLMNRVGPFWFIKRIGFQGELN